MCGKLFSFINSKKGILLALSVLIVAGSFLRFWNLGTQSYWMDEGYTVNAVMSVLEKGSTILDSGKEYSCPTYCYPAARFVQLLGDTPVSYRIFSVFAGIALIGMIFLFTRKLFTTHIALLTSFFITFSYWQIAWSRQARWYTLFTLFFWLALYFFYKTLYEDKNKYLNICITLVCTALAIATHKIGYVLLFIFITWGIADQLFSQKRFNKKQTLLLAFPVTLLTLTTLFFFNPLSHVTLHYQLPYYLSFYLRTYWLFIFFAIIACFSKQLPYKKEILFLLTIALAYLIPLSFLTDIVHYRYLFHITPIFFILGSLGIYAAYTEIQPLWGKVLLVLITLSLFATVAGGVFIPRTNYYLESDSRELLGDRPHYASTPQPNWNAAYAYIQENKKDSEVIVSSHPHFTKIFLHEAGYWIKYNYLGYDNKVEYRLNDREYYVGAKILDDLAELQILTETSHGFIIFDRMASTGRIDEDILDFIQTYPLVFHEKTNSYSEVWVYRF